MPVCRSDDPDASVELLKSEIKNLIGNLYFKLKKVKKERKHLSYLLSKLNKKYAANEILTQKTLMDYHDKEVDMSKLNYELKVAKDTLTKYENSKPINYKVWRYLTDISVDHLYASHPRNLWTSNLLRGDDLKVFDTTEERKERLAQYLKRDRYNDFVREWKILHGQDKIYKLTQEEKNNLFVDIQGFHYVMIAQRARENKRVTLIHLADDNGRVIIPMYTVYKSIRNPNVLVNNYNEFFRTSKHGIPIFYRKTHEYL